MLARKPCFYEIASAAVEVNSRPVLRTLTWSRVLLCTYGHQFPASLHFQCFHMPFHPPQPQPQPNYHRLLPSVQTSTLVLQASMDRPCKKANPIPTCKPCLSAPSTQHKSHTPSWTLTAVSGDSESDKGIRNQAAPIYLQME